jgi:ubiquinol-cytochrome c reductase subunit 7
LLVETNKDVAEALKLLPQEEMCARHYRHKRAFQLSLMHQTLPKEKWTTPEQDVRYLQPLIEQARRERMERESFDYPGKRWPLPI